MRLKYIFELLPVMLAFAAAISCSVRFTVERRKDYRVAMIIAAVCAILLVVAQTSWWVSYAINGNLQGTVFANTIWTIFNSLTMVTFIMVSSPWRK